MPIVVRGMRPECRSSSKQSGGDGRARGICGFLQKQGAVRMYQEGLVMSEADCECASAWLSLVAR